MLSIIILGGGKATRMGDICKDTPKEMLSFGEAPFLAYMVSHFVRLELGEIIIIRGHIGHVVEDYFGNERWRSRGVRTVEYLELAGTARAAKVGVAHAQYDRTFMCNADTVLGFDFARILSLYTSQSLPVMSFVTTQEGVQNQGAVLVQKSVIQEFDEGKPSKPTGIRALANGAEIRGSNVGCYFMDRAFALGPEGIGTDLRFERETIPRWVADGKVAGSLMHEKAFLDFGTPERFAELQGRPEILEVVYGKPM